LDEWGLLPGRGRFRYDPTRDPFPGLRAFEEEDAAVFFGRSVETDDLIERIESARVRGAKDLNLVLGASGSGKS
jgi:hypothetical protein